MIDISKAITIVRNQTPRLEGEKIGIDTSVGRVLHEDIVADSDLPPFDRSQMDGYAVIASDTEKVPVSLQIVGESAAGKGWHKILKQGEAVRIMTGAPLPKGADAVQKVELTSEADGRVKIAEPTETERYIIRRGSEIKKGNVIIRSGEVINENLVATIAAFGYANVRVGKQPRIAILGTGSEIVDISKKPGRDQIRNSNSVMLDALCRKFWAKTTILPIAKDEISDLKFRISNTIGSDRPRRDEPKFQILVITGGVSVGKYDHTKTALAELGAEIFFEKLRLKPGKPAVFARLGKTLIFALPGNPVSAAVTFYLFVRTAILQMQGASATDLRKGSAVLAADVNAARDRDTFLPAEIDTNKKGQLIAQPLRWKGSSDFIGFGRSSVLIFVPKATALKKGDVADIYFL